MASDRRADRCILRPRRSRERSLSMPSHERRRRAGQLHPPPRVRRRRRRRDLARPDERRLHRHRRRRRRRRRSPASPSTSSSSSTSSSGDRSAADVCRELRSTPSTGRDPGPVHQPDRRRRGADPLPRGRRRRRHGQAVRRPRARGPGRGAAPPLPALARPHPDSWHRAAPRPRRGRVVAVFSPKGGVGTTTIAVNVAVATAMRRPDRTAPHRPRPPVRPGRDPPQPDGPGRRSPTSSGTKSALREPELLRTYAATPREWPARARRRRARPSWPRPSRTSTSSELLANAAEAYDVVIVDAGSHLDERR